MNHVFKKTIRKTRYFVEVIILWDRSCLNGKEGIVCF